MTRPKLKIHRNDIDGLRAIAVIAVIINHFDKTILPYGHLGVDVFFAISGFVITQSLLNKKASSLGSFIYGFFTRRIKRLVPALFVCVLITSFLSLLCIPPNSDISLQSLQSGITSLFGLSNVFLYYKASNYFSPSSSLNPFTHTWSLGVEEQFYLVFPFIVFLSGVTRKSSVVKTYFPVFIGLAGACSYLSYCLLNPTSQIAAFYLMPNRFWELGAGSLCYYGTNLWKEADGRDLKKNLLACLGNVSLLLLPVTFYFLPSDFGYSTTVTIILSCLIICSVRAESCGYTILSSYPLAFLGQISYSLYLWHWSILTLARWTVGIHAETIPALILVILILAVISHRYLEQPLRYSDWQFIKFRKLSYIGPFSYFLLSGVSLTLILQYVAIPANSKGTLYTGVKAHLKKKGVETLLEESKFQKSIWNPVACALATNEETGKVISSQNCTIDTGNNSKRRILVIGNSYSAAEIEMYKVIPKEKMGSVTITSSWGASIVPEVINTSPWKDANSHYWKDVIPSLISELKQGDIVLMVNDGGDFSPTISNQVQQDRLNKLKMGLDRLAKELSAIGVAVIYQTSLPFLRDSLCNPDTAVLQWWHIAEKPPCLYFSRDDTINRRMAYQNSLEEVQKQNTNFFILDLLDVFCPEGLCTFYNKQGVFLYRDEYSHPSIEAGKLAQPELSRKIKEVVRSSFFANRRGTINRHQAN